MTKPEAFHDPARWTVTVLPLPRRMAFARVSGLCGGHVVGETESRSEASAEGTDGAWVVGTVGRTGGQRAALWPADGSRVIVLGDEPSLSAAGAVADGEQVGVRWAGRSSAPALWRGSDASFVDLTPERGGPPRRPRQPRTRPRRRARLRRSPTWETRSSASSSPRRGPSRGAPTRRSR